MTEKQPRKESYVTKGNTMTDATFNDVDTSEEMFIAAELAMIAVAHMEPNGEISELGYDRIHERLYLLSDSQVIAVYEMFEGFMKDTDIGFDFSQVNK